SMLGASIGIAALQTSQYFGTGKDPEPLGSAHPRNAPYQIFQCRDGHFGLAAGNNSLWRSVCNVVNRPELIEDKRFLTPSDRAENQSALKDILEAIFKNDTADTWLQRFSAAGVPCAPLNTYSMVLDDKQVEYMNWVQDLTLPNGVKTKTVVSPLRFDNQTSSIARRPPQLGEHNDELLPSEDS